MFEFIIFNNNLYILFVTFEIYLIFIIFDFELKIPVLPSKSKRNEIPFDRDGSR